MTEASVINSLISQAPGLAGVVIVVWIFLKAIEKRDQLFVSQMNNITERLAAMERTLTDHDANSRAAYKDRSDTLDRIERKINIAMPAKTKAAK